MLFVLSEDEIRRSVRDPCQTDILESTACFVLFVRYGYFPRISLLYLVNHEGGKAKST